MKRFFCKVCNRIRRSNSYPADVVLIHTDDQTNRSGMTPLEVHVPRRMGTCWRHGGGRPLQRPVRQLRIVPAKVKPSAPQRKGKR